MLRVRLCNPEHLHRVIEFFGNRTEQNRELETFTKCECECECEYNRMHCAMRVFSSSLMFKQNNIGSRNAGNWEPAPPLTAGPSAGAAALLGVCILLLITKASEEFKIEFEFEFLFVSFRFVSFGRQPQENNKPKNRAMPKMKRKSARNACDHFMNSYVK